MTAFPWIEAISLLIALAAAVGTIWIAILNTRILRRQTDIQNEALLREERLRRALLGADLLRGANADLLAKLNGKPTDPDIFKELGSSMHGRVAQVESKTKRRALGFVSKVLRAAVIAKGDRRAYERARDLIDSRIEEWIDDPATANLSIPDGYFP